MLTVIRRRPFGAHELGITHRWLHRRRLVVVLTAVYRPRCTSRRKRRSLGGRIRPQCHPCKRHRRGTPSGTGSVRSRPGSPSRNTRSDPGRRCPAVIDGAAEIRQQAFTLFIRTYDQLRRAVHYLRWEHGDAEEIAPSLYAASRRRSSRSGKSKTTPPESDVAQAGAEAPVDATPAPAAGKTRPAAPRRHFDRATRGR